jgi:hypothetical protein
MGGTLLRGENFLIFDDTFFRAGLCLLSTLDTGGKVKNRAQFELKIVRDQA